MTKKTVRNVAILALVIVVIAWIIGKTKSSPEGEDIVSSSLKIPPSYTLVLNPDDAQRLQDTPSMVYKVVRNSPDQVDLLAKPEPNILGMQKDWKSVIRFNPSQNPPFVATCEELTSGVYTPGKMKMTPNSQGGFNFEYLQDSGDKPLITGVLVPNWY